MPHLTNRSDDELHLAWMAHREAGHSSSTIASVYGVRSERVRVVLNRIRSDYAKSADGADVFGGQSVQ